MRMIRWIVGGTLLAAVGVVPLLALSLGHLPIILIGLLAGLGVRWASRPGDPASPRAWTASIIAVSVTLLAYLGYGIVIAEPLLKKERLMTVLLARYLVQEAREAGEKVELPAGKNLENTLFPHDFPPGVWDEAELCWKRLSPEDRAAVEQEYDRLVPNQSRMKWQMIGGGFEAMLRGSGFSFMLLIGLASFVGGSKPREAASPSDSTAVAEAGSDLANEGGTFGPFAPGDGDSSRGLDDRGDSADRATSG